MGRNPKNGAAMVNVTIKITRELHAKLRVLAIDKGISHVQLLEQVISDYIRKQRTYATSLTDSS